MEDVRKLVEEASALALVGAKDTGVRVRFDFDPRVNFVLADKVQVQQVLLNLMRNAIEAMEYSEKRDLVISTTVAPEDMVAIAVSDTGTGIAPEISAQLFQPFSPQSGRAWVSVCRFHARLSRRMAAPSCRAPIPAVERSFHSLCQRSATRMPAMPSDKMLVHIIDDDQAMRESLVFLFRTAHIAAETFASGPAFLASLPDDRLRCVITDVRMPEMSGLNCCGACGK